LGFLFVTIGGKTGTVCNRDGKICFVGGYFLQVVEGLLARIGDGQDLKMSK